jgi:hypothetical protein
VLKKAGVVAAAAAGILMLAGPAFAAPSHARDNDTHNGQVGLINLNDIDILKDINLNLIAGVCGNNVGVLGAAVPILSPSITHSCAGGGIDD